MKILNSTYKSSYKLYDLVSSVVKNTEVTEAEIRILNKYINEIKLKYQDNFRILDLGCGTGRHLLYLSKQNLKIDGIDQSTGMIKILKNKLQNNFRGEIINSSFLKHKFKNRYNLVYSFWNTINEMCLTRKTLYHFFRKLNSIVNLDGIVVLNFDDINKFNYKNLEYEYQMQSENESSIYMFHSKVEKFIKKINTTKTREKIYKITKNINEGQEHRKQIYNCFIHQRWWNIEEITKIAQKNNFSILSFEKIKVNDEFYLVLKK